MDIIDYIALHHSQHVVPKRLLTSNNSHKLNRLVLNPEHAVLITLICNSFLIWRKGNLQASHIVLLSDLGFSLDYGTLGNVLFSWLSTTFLPKAMSDHYNNRNRCSSESLL